MKNIQQKLPDSHIAYTDKYFLRSNEILKKEGLNPVIAIKFFCRGSGPVAGLDEALAIIRKYSNIEKTGGEVWVTVADQFRDNLPIMIIKGPAQSIIELETMLLGVLSSAISLAEGIEPPTPKQVTDKLKKLKDIYMDIPIIYFGARHYHWSLDKQIAGAALKGGAIQTSTDVGSSNIGQKGGGTIPHLLPIILASVYGKEIATLKAAQLFDKHIPLEIPRVTLVDTFNQEISDTLTVAEYFGVRMNSFRIDTCGENIGQHSTPYTGQTLPDPGFMTGPGVTIELITNIRDQLIKNGYGENTELFLSSGFGNEAKAQAFVNANNVYRTQKGYNLFAAVGIGEIAPGRFCTADIFQVNGQPLAKTGREQTFIDYSILKQVL